MRKLPWLTLLLLMTLSHLAQAATDIKSIRAWAAPDNVRLVFDLSSKVDHNVFMLANPRRLVLDVKDAKLDVDVGKLQLAKGPIQDVRTGKRGDGVRFVFDLKDKVTPKSFQLDPNDQYGYRLVLDLDTGSGDTAATKTILKGYSPASRGKLRDIVIAVDPGHGGEDPGATGPGGVHEKDVVLPIARDLVKMINAEPGYKAELTRSGDYYITLRGRTREARKMHADLFVSVHADAARDHRAKGASVWVLSGRGATSEMGRWLARRENSADLIGGVGSVSLEDKGSTLAGVLLDMSMTASRANSREVAKRIHQNIAKFTRMHKPYVENAAFVVLKSPDIPSVLVETGFISNRQEARHLTSRSYQHRMAQAIFRGITGHFWARPPAMTLIAAKKRGDSPLAAADRTYRVESGDTLSVIAVRNGVSLSDLRSANQISGDRIRVGQVLKIPAS